MRLYHTSNVEIRLPDIRRGRKNADFGQGFYLTPDLDFARRWAGTDAVINEYELDETGLKIRRFTRSEDWFRCIFENRRLKDSLTADVVIGPTANDTIFETMGIISSGYLSPQEAMKLLMIGPEFTQAAVKTQKAADQLRWIRADRILKQEEASRKAEQEEYQAEFARMMEEIAGE